MTTAEEWAMESGYCFATSFGTISVSQNALTGLIQERNNLATQLDQAAAIIRRNLASLRKDINLKGQINQQRHDDYVEACRICGVEP